MGNPSGRNPRRNVNRKGAQKRLNSTFSADSGESGMNNFDGDRLVETELDAAFALAEFSKLIHRNEEGFLLQQWGKKRRRSRVRNPASPHIDAVKEECQPLEETPGSSSPTSQEAVKVSIPDKEETDCKTLNTYNHVHLTNAKFEPVYASAKVEPKISSLLPCLHESRFRQSMTQIEKEARRLRRIQANRESARQTIRRKQVLLEELTQKAAKLAFENETMKQQTELAMQEYNSLKDKNKQLKEQVASNSRDLAHKGPVHSQVSEIQASKLQSMQIPFLHHNEMPLPPFLWKTGILPASTATQAFAPENREGVPIENDQFLTMNRQMAFNFWTIPSGNSQWHVSPFFLPYMSAFSQGVQSSPSRATEPSSITGVACTSLGCQSSPSTTIRADVDNTLMDAETARISRSSDSNASNQNEMLQEISSDRILQNSNFEPHTYTHGMSVSHSPIAITSSSMPFSNREVTVQGGLPCNKAALNRMCSGHWSLPSKESYNPQIFPSLPNLRGNLPTWVQDPWYLSKRLSGAVAAFEARKRRKELTRNKSIQSRQLKLQS